MKTKTLKPTKKQLETSVNSLVNKHKETLEDIEILDFFKDCLEPSRVLALAKHLDLILEDALNNIIEDADGERFTYRNEEYYILTDGEADQKNEESIENYIDECILPLMPENLQNYFDTKSFIEDAKMDGRGHNLAAYDGNENDQEIDNTTYYIYRWN